MKLFKKKEDFFDLFGKMSANLLKTSALIVEVFDKGEGVPEKVKRISDLEHDGDLLTHEIIRRLNKTFLWNTAMTLAGMPISCSHSLIGALMGTGVALGGAGCLNGAGLTKIFASLLASPVLGVLAGYLLMKAILFAFGRLSPGTVNRVFGRLQILSSAFMAFSHGSNDAQKTMGVITLALLSGGYIKTMEVPMWVVLACALAMGLGTAVGGWRVIRTVGCNMLKLQPVNGFAAETAATGIIIGASHFGLPVSTTHVITTSIMGVGATRRLSAVRWGVAGKILMAWVFTLPVCFGIGWAACAIYLAATG